MSLHPQRRFLVVGSALLAILAASILWSARDVLRSSSALSGTAAVSAAPELTPKQIASRALRATVQIRARDALESLRGDASGFFISEDGLIATNLHVISGAYSLEVETAYGKVHDTVYFVAADPRRDLAVLKVNARDAKALGFASNADPDIGEAVFVTGNPLGQTGTFSDGLVSGRRSAEGVSFLQISAPISPGSSGGPVMNAQGEVLGVMSFRLLRGQNLNYAIPVRYLRRLIDSMPEPVRYARGLLPMLNRPVLPASDATVTQTGHPDTTLDVLSRQLRRADSMVIAAGGVAEGASMRDAIAEGDSTTRVFRAVHGAEYLIVGVCDEHCTMMDLKVAGPGGEVVDIDARVDDAPKVRFVAGQMGRYTITATMQECDVKRCELGLRTYRIEATTVRK